LLQGCEACEPCEGDAAGAFAGAIQHRTARIAGRLKHALRPIADLMDPAIRGHPGARLVDHRIAGMAERAISAVAGDADPLRR